MLNLLNILMFVGHDLIIIINLFGWIFPSTRRLQRITLAATLFSWIVMGARYGWGYCACTDWHFQVRRQLGIHGNESSYTQLLLHQLTGFQASREFANNLTLSLMIGILIGTAISWRHDIRKRRSTEMDSPEQQVTALQNPEQHSIVPKPPAD